VNVGNPRECTVLELAEKIIELTRSRSRIVFEPLPSDDPARRCPDITLAKAMLGWEPRVPLEEGLGKTIAYFESLQYRSAHDGARVDRPAAA
jgi:UDP-glucuronate decarboxylase